MKIAGVVIKNFRHIERLALDFTDAVGRVRDMTLLVGPNTSGKTTILDALAVGLGYITELGVTRPDFVLAPQTIVRPGTLQTEITYTIRFSSEEIEATRRLYKLSSDEQKVPDAEEVTITWKYPDLKASDTRGHTYAEPRHSWQLFKGRNKAARLLSTGVAGPEWFERVGGIFTFDQQRTGMGKTIPRHIWNILQREKEDAERYTTDPKTILLSLAIASLVPSEGRDEQPDQFERIQKEYARVCHHHQIKEVRRDTLNQYDLIFTNGEYEYRYSGLSSGEQMLLLFLIRMVTEYIHQSVVLVDEIELHQHPLWQQKLLHLLPRIGQNNQIIATTHSAYLRDALPVGAVIHLGELGDKAQD